MKTGKGISRRDFLKIAGSTGIALAFSNGSIRVFGQGVPETFIVASHAIHKTVATTGPGGNVITPWLAETGVGRVEWRTAPIQQETDLLFREASLRETSIDVGFLLNRYWYPRVTGLFDPLDPYQKSDPIDDFSDFFPGMIKAATINDKLYGVPVRHSTSGLHYNEEFFEEKGLSGPPTTIEEFAEYAKKLTYTRDDGSRVYGFIYTGTGFANVTDVARAWNGDFITLDYQVVCNEPPMVKAITMLHDMFKEGVLPTGLITMGQTDIVTWMQQGRAAMTISGFGRNQIYNNAEQSKFAGHIRTTNVPISQELKGKFDVAPVKTEFWSMVIPHPSHHKDLSWSFIRHLASKKATLAMALNGNGATRASTYEQSAYTSKVPYAAAIQRALLIARVPLPAFNKSPQASDAITEEVQAGILGAKTPQRAMDDLAKRLEALLKTS